MVRWAPFSVPIERRIQTFSALILYIWPLVLILLNLVMLFVPIFWMFYGGYLLWMFFVDYRTPERGGRMIPFIRKLKIWKYVRDYFPAELIVSTPLDPSKNYIFGLHPHGIISISASINLLNDHGAIREKLKGIDYRVCTLHQNFRIPFLRDFIMSEGLVSVSRNSLLWLLRHNISAMIVVGGAAEALESRPGNHKLVLKKRKGFVKMALETGSNLVPVYMFGENHLFDQVPNNRGTRLRTFQDRLKDKLGFTLPLFHGRGIWNYDFGIMPYRYPLVTVIGKPIEVPHIAEPTEEQVNKYHELYIHGLTQLFEEYQPKYAPDAKGLELED